jgi:hypothetical protein
MFTVAQRWRGAAEAPAGSRQRAARAPAKARRGIDVIWVAGRERGFVVWNTLTRDRLFKCRPTDEKIA